MSSATARDRDRDLVGKLELSRAQYSENNSATRVTIHEWVDVRERPKRELLHTPIRL